MNEIDKERLKISSAKVITLSDKTVDLDGQQTITVRDEDYFITSISTRQKTDVQKGDKVLIVENTETGIPFMLKNERTGENIFSTFNKDYNKDPFYIYLIMMLPFGSIIGVSTILDSLKKQTSNSYYKDKKILKPFKVSLVFYVLSLLSSCMLAFYYINDKIFSNFYGVVAFLMSLIATAITYKANNSYFVGLLNNSEKLINEYNNKKKS